MFTVAICDDDKIVLSSIQKCIEEFATENNISISVDLYDSGKKLLESSLKYNVIFLDIILQTENGIDIGTQLRKLNAFTYIIYITNYKQYHETAHNNVHSFAFLTKPISKKIIYKCSCAKFLTQILIFFDTNFSAFSGSILRKLICIFCVKINKNLYIKQHIFYNYFRYRNRQ